MSTIHGDEDEDQPEPVPSSNWILIVSGAVALLVLIAGAIFIGLDLRSADQATAEAGSAPPRPSPAPSPTPAGQFNPLVEGNCVAQADGLSICLLPSGTICVQTSLGGGECHTLAAESTITVHPLTVTLTDWLARLPVPVTLSTRPGTRHGEVRLDGTLAVVDVDVQGGERIFKADCQVRADNDAKLTQPALDFVRACGAAVIPPGDGSTKATMDWFGRRAVPVDQRQPRRVWYCGPLDAELIMDRSTADLVLTANPRTTAGCQESLG